MKRIKARPPMLVMRNIHDAELDKKELGAALRFKWGTATKSDFDLLLDLLNMMLIAGCTSRQREYIIKFVDDVGMPALKSIKERFDRTGKLGVSGREGAILVDITTISKDFWNRQPIELYDVCGRELKAYYKTLGEKGREIRDADRANLGSDGSAG